MSADDKPKAKWIVGQFSPFLASRSVFDLGVMPFSPSPVWNSSKALEVKIPRLEVFRSIFDASGFPERSPSLTSTWSTPVAGVVLGGRGDRLTNARIRLQLHAVYGTVVFLLESVVFSLIGLALPAQVRALSDGDRAWPLYALAVAGTLIAVRLLWLAPLSAVVQRKGGVHRVNWRVPMVLTWAGTRGVLPLAAALSIPEVTRTGATLPDRPLVLVLTTSVVVVTLVVQGFTLAPVVRRSGIALEPDHTEREEASARCRLADAGIRRLDELAELEAVPDVVLDRLRRGLNARLDDARDRLSDNNTQAAHAEIGRASCRERVLMSV